MTHADLHKATAPHGGRYKNPCAAGDGFSRNDYFHNLVKTVLSTTRRCHAIIAAYATDSILPANHGLRVRVVALEQCSADGALALILAALQTRGVHND